jgi:glycosyltransferase involved in cell wall biosynthesis
MESGAISEPWLKPFVRGLVPPILYSALARLKGRREVPAAESTASSSAPLVVEPLDSFTFVLSFWFFHEDWWTRPQDCFYLLPLELSRAHVVGWFHDAIPLAEQGAEGGVTPDDFMKVVGLIGLRADTIVCGAESAERDLRRIYPEAATKTIVIPYGHDAARFRAQAARDTAESVRARFGIPGARYFVMLGTEPLTKNVSRVLRAFADVAGGPGHEQLSLVLVGPVRHAELEDAVAKARSVASIVTVAYVPDEQLPGLLGHSQALVYASLVEGFGIPPLEAMSAGTLVIASAIEPLTDICGSIPLYCDPLSVASISEAMAASLSLTPSERKLRVAAGQEHAGQYTWDRSAEALVERLREAAGLSRA